MKITNLQEKNSLSALSPECQTAREKEALYNDPRFHERLQKSETVVEIRKTTNGYTVVTNQGREISVELRYLPSGIGPQKFEFVFEDSQTCSSKVILRKAAAEAAPFQEAIHNLLK